MAQNFAHLHVHTDASRIDGLGTVDRLVGAAKALDFKHLAMTDHGSLANAIAFNQACTTADIKPLLGMEGYVAVDGNVGHITLLADGNRGFSSLVALNNIGQRSEYRRPAFEVDDLLKHADGLICLSGCIASPLHSMEWPDARRLATRLKSVFGSRFFAEAMFVNDVPDWNRIAHLAQDLKLPIVTTNDVHFAYPEDAPIHSVLTSLKASFTYESRALFLATAEQIEQRLVSAGADPEGLRIARTGFENSLIIANKLSPVVFSSKPSLPSSGDSHMILKDKIQKALKQFPDDEYLERAGYEFGIIADKDYETYFLILEDVVAYAKANGIRVGAGRGSGVGSLVLYLLNVTDIDPLKYNLSFERFLNPKRKGMPDVDIDFDSEGRHLVIEYAKKRYGAWPVATYSRYSHKMLVHDLSKHFRLPRDLEAQAADEGVESEAFQALTEKATQFKPAYDAMEGQIRHIGRHAGGVVITDADVPLERTKDGGLVAAWTEGGLKELSSAGIIKFDFLGLSSLSVLRDLETKLRVKASPAEKGDPAFSLFQDGNLSGIFQFSGSEGIAEFTRSVKPVCFEDLVAINALYRPGALDAGTATRYPEWRKKPRKLHPLIDRLLEETFGVVVYQEQMMAIYSVITDGGLADADEARRVLSKRQEANPEWEITVARLQLRFIEGAERQGLDGKLAKKIWNELMAHGRYSFNKSHAVAYAQIAWETAWFKYNYPMHFYAASLNYDLENAQRYFFNILNEDIQIAFPHVNVSTDQYQALGDKIVMPLSIVKHLGVNGAKTITDNQPYDSIADFMARVPKKEVKARARAGLYEIGAFAGLEGTFEDMQVKTKVEYSSSLEAQQAILGLIVPPKATLDRIRQAADNGLLAGIIVGVENKESRWGKYVVYRLVPNGAVWSREFTDMKAGQFVEAKVKRDSGKILKVKELAL